MQYSIFNYKASLAIIDLVNFLSKYCHYCYHSARVMAIETALFVLHYILTPGFDR